MPYNKFIVLNLPILSFFFWINVNGHQPNTFQYYTNHIDLYIYIYYLFFQTIFDSLDALFIYAKIFPTRIFPLIKFNKNMRIS